MFCIGYWYRVSETTDSYSRMEQTNINIHVSHYNNRLGSEDPSCDHKE